MIFYADRAARSSHEFRARRRRPASSACRASCSRTATCIGAANTCPASGNCCRTARASGLLQEYRVAGNLDFMHLELLFREAARLAAVAQTPLPQMLEARQHFPVEHAVAQRNALVRAGSLAREETIAGVDDADVAVLLDAVDRDV